MRLAGLVVVTLAMLGEGLAHAGLDDQKVDGNEQTSLPQSVREMETPVNPLFLTPAPNACQSKYDRFYEAEPGVYAYWSLCEKGAPAQIYDYVGQFDLTKSSKAWGSGIVAGGAAGPVPDGETAASVPTASFEVESQGIPLNTHEGTISAWVNADATSYPVTAVFLGAVAGKSVVSIGVSAATGICFNGNYANSAGTVFTTQKCGYTANTWHRVTFSWSAGVLTLYVDGTSGATGSYAGALDNKVFYYKLFPGCCNTGKQMSLAKASVANKMWTAREVASDFEPELLPIPPGGVYVTSQRLGSIHRDVLGYSDSNQDISTPDLRAALIKGLRAAGVTSVRYAGGYGGIDADLEDWRGGDSCTHTKGTKAPNRNRLTADNLDNFFSNVAIPLKLSVVFTVNYSTNPPRCDSGGDPNVNGADLVAYSNLTRRYGIRHWEIGNELYSHLSEADFHSDPNSGASYLANEPAFYAAMKAKDPNIQIAVPIGLGTYSLQTEFSLPVLASGSYDAVVWHSYPMRDPITDGDTVFPDRVASHMNRVRGSLLKLQTELLNNRKNPDAIWITEWNGEVSGNKWSKQTMGAVTPLFVTSQLAEFMQAGVQLATWWVQGRPNGCSTLNYDGQGETAYSWWECGATGLVYAGPTPGHGEVEIGLHPGDLTPAGRAFQILSQSGFVTEGEHMLRTGTDNEKSPWLMSYAATHGDSVAVILINRDLNDAHSVPISFAGATPGGLIEQWTYGRTQYDKSRYGDWSATPMRSTFIPHGGPVQIPVDRLSVTILIFHQ